MRKILKSTLILLLTMFGLYSCSTNEAMDNTQLSREKSNAANYSVEKVGALHSSGLDFFFNTYFSNNENIEDKNFLHYGMQTELRKFLDIHSLNVQENYSYMINYGFSRESNEEVMRVSLSRDLGFSFSSDFYTIISELENAFEKEYEEFNNFSDLLKRDNRFNQLSEIEKNIIAYGVEVYKDSYNYWMNKHYLWDDLWSRNISNWTVFNNYNQKYSFNTEDNEMNYTTYGKGRGWKYYAKIDAIGAVAGGIGGAIAGGISGAFAGGVGAVPGAIAGGVGGAVGGAVSGSLTAFLVKDSGYQVPFDPTYGEIAQEVFISSPILGDKVLSTRDVYDEIFLPRKYKEVITDKNVVNQLYNLLKK